jgi:hypothetical protein
MTDEQRDQLIAKHGRDVLSAAASMLALKMLIARCDESSPMKESAINALTCLMMFASKIISNDEPQPIIDACDDIERITMADAVDSKQASLDDGIFKFDLGGKAT